SLAWGTATVLYDSYTREFGLGGNIGSLSSAVTGAHLHQGAPGVAGPVQFAIPDAPIGFTLGAINVGPVALDTTQEADLFNANWYVNVETESYPLGEVRGQLQLGAEIPEPESVAALAGTALAAFALWRRLHNSR